MFVVILFVKLFVSGVLWFINKWFVFIIDCIIVLMFYGNMLCKLIILYDILFLRVIFVVFCRIFICVFYFNKVILLFFWIIFVLFNGSL